MVFARKYFNALKENPLALAATISLAVHLIIFSGWKLNQRFRWWNSDQAPGWLQKLSPDLSKTLHAKTATQSQVPLMFVDVDPQVTIKEAPKETKFYGAANSQAASVETSVKSDLPDLQGKQDKVIKTTENSPSKAQPLQPTPAKPDALEDEEAKPRENQVIGDLAVAKPREQNKNAEGESEKETRPRPRKLSEVSGSRGEKMKQPGGAKRLALQPSFDVKATSFGDYDGEFIDAVRECWYQSMEGRGTVPGKVVVEFNLNSDGTVTELRVAENTTANALLEIICTRAIQVPSPYRKWPLEMRRELKSDSREVRFTFYYE